VTKALIFDSFFDKHRGVIAFVRIFSGEFKAGDTANYLATSTKNTIQEVGYFAPQLTACDTLSSGEVGYIVTGTKDISVIKVGDTVCDKSDITQALPGYTEIQPKVFASLFPIEHNDFAKLKEAMGKLKLSDASLTYDTENLPALGFGFRCGFLGLLHMDIVQERLNREFDLDLIMTTPSVGYRLVKHDGTVMDIKNPNELPDPSQIKTLEEPFARVEIITPQKYIGSIIELITSSRGMYTQMSEISEGQLQIVAEIPLAELIISFYDALKSSTKGYATINYSFLEFRAGDLVRIDFLVNKEPVTPLSIITHRSDSDNKGRDVCSKLKELIPRQQFDIAVQASIGAKIIARETIKAYRKDVTADMYGGDISRRMKLLDKQKKGKKKMKTIGNVEIPQSAFMNVLKK
jgi:GTP-binding protein LepA